MVRAGPNPRRNRGAMQASSTGAFRKVRDGFEFLVEERGMTNRLWCVAVILAGFAGIALTSTPSDAGGAKALSVKDIMVKAHKGNDCLIQKVGKELKAAEPAWADVQKMTREMAELGAALGKNKPPQGEKASWDKFAKEY